MRQQISGAKQFTSKVIPARRGDTPRSLARSSPRPSAFAIESLEERKLFASALALGINTTTISAGNYKSVVQALRDSGTNTVRLWYGFDDYGERDAARVTYFAKRLKYDGFDVMMTVTPDGGKTGTPDQTRALMQYLVGIDGLTDAVDRWEIGNEEDASMYWKGTLKTYVSDLLAPASEVLHAAGEKVVSGGVSWNPDDVQRLVDQGALRYVDFVGYHPYARGTSMLKNNLAKVKAIVGGVPLVASEWNVRGHEKDASPEAWAAEIKDFWPIIRDNFYAAYYFTSVTLNTPAGPAGVLNTDGTPNQPFYSTYMSFQQTLGGGAATPKPPGLTPSGNAPTTPATPTPEETAATEAAAEAAAAKAASAKAAAAAAQAAADEVVKSATAKAAQAAADKAQAAADRAEADAKDAANALAAVKAAAARAAAADAAAAKAAADKLEADRAAASKAWKIARAKAALAEAAKEAAAKPTPVVTTPAPAPKPRPVVVPPAISSLSLVNAADDTIAEPYAVLSGYTTIDLATTGTTFLSVLASGNRKTNSIRFTIDGTEIVDSTGAATLFGEKHGDIVGGDLGVGTYTVTAQAFSGENATGTAGEVVTVQLNVIDTSARTINSTPASDLAARRAARRNQDAANSVL